MVGLENPALSTWETMFGAVKFTCDGKIYAMQRNGSSADVLLAPYAAGSWYHIVIDSDLTARTFDVYINGSLVASGLSILDSGMPTGVEVDAGHGGNPTVWFDDIRISSSVADVSGCFNLEGFPGANRKVILRQNLETDQVTSTDQQGWAFPCYLFKSKKTHFVAIYGSFSPVRTEPWDIIDLVDNSTSFYPSP